MAKTKKSKLENLQETNAKDYAAEKKAREENESKASTKRNPRKTLDELINNRTNSYATEDVEEYREELLKKNLVELQEESIKVGRIPRADKYKLIDNLCKAFTEYQNVIRAPRKQPTVIKKTPQLEKALRLL